MDALKNMIGKKEARDAQPGSQVEAQADTTANQFVDQAASNAGISQQAEQGLNDIVDTKINSEIPGGN